LRRGPPAARDFESLRTLKASLTDTLARDLLASRYRVRLRARVYGRRLATGGAPANLAGAPAALILAGAGTPAVLARAPLAVMRADACAPAVLAAAGALLAVAPDAVLDGAAYCLPPNLGVHRFKFCVAPERLAEKSVAIPGVAPRPGCLARVVELGCAPCRRSTFLRNLVARRAAAHAPPTHRLPPRSSGQCPSPESRPHKVEGAWPSLHNLPRHLRGNMCRPPCLPTATV